MKRKADIETAVLEARQKGSDTPAKIFNYINKTLRADISRTEVKQFCENDAFGRCLDTTTIPIEWVRRAEYVVPTSNTNEDCKAGNLENCTVGNYAVDLVDMSDTYKIATRGYRYIITFLNLQSRKAYAAEMKTRTMLEILRNTRLLMDKMKKDSRATGKSHLALRSIVSDNEFNKERFRQLVQELWQTTVRFKYTEPYTHELLGRIDKFRCSI